MCTYTCGCVGPVRFGRHIHFWANCALIPNCCPTKTPGLIKTVRVGRGGGGIPYPIGLCTHCIVTGEGGGGVDSCHKILVSVQFGFKLEQLTLRKTGTASWESGELAVPLHRADALYYSCMHVKLYIMEISGSVVTCDQLSMSYRYRSVFAGSTGHLDAALIYCNEFTDLFYELLIMPIWDINILINLSPVLG